MTGNFGFLQAQWPQLYREARNAERDALFDARTTCFYARRAVELNASRAVIGVIEQLNASADAG